MKFTSAVRTMAAIACFIPSFAAHAQEVSQVKDGSREASAPITAARLARADFKEERPGPDARAIADWVVESGDGGRKPFAIVDKKAARVFVFDAEGRLLGAAAALLGIAAGDHSAPGIGERELSAIPFKDRTTPAGRFEAALGKNDKGKQILWLDYDSALSMHPVVDPPGQRRPHRLATATPQDNRISFGCINVPVAFFADVVKRSFTGTGGNIYVLPEVRSLRSVFTAYAAERPDGLAVDKGSKTPADRTRR
jgi:hypothetical protein